MLKCSKCGAEFVPTGPFRFDRFRDLGGHFGVPSDVWNDFLNTLASLRPQGVGGSLKKISAVNILQDGTEVPFPETIADDGGIKELEFAALNVDNPRTKIRVSIDKAKKRVIFESFEE
ncbi:MAG: hypothetical protein QXN56_01370 [Candidatus Hadarchaeum sp.]